jgi:peptidoglycan/LPS O-acetylase OafA/YrhL
MVVQTPDLSTGAVSRPSSGSTIGPDDFGPRPVPGTQPLSSDEPVTSPRNAALDGLRALAALAVFGFHAMTRGDADFGPFGALIGGRSAFTIFFVLSGYLLYRPFLTGQVSVIRYAVRRVLRIMPAYVVALVGISLITGSRRFWDHPASYLLFLQNYDPDLVWQFLSPAWTLVIEVTFYAALPLIAFVVLRTSRGDPRRMLALVGLMGVVSFGFAAWVFARYAGPTADGFASRIQLSFPVYLWLFAIGMLIAIGDAHAPHVLRRAASRRGLLGAAGLLILGFLASPDFFNPLAAGGAAILVAAAVSTRVEWGRWGTLALVAGELSFAFSLWHADLISALTEVFPKPGAAVLPAFVAAIAVAGVSWIVIERPAIRLGRRLTRRERQRPLMARPVASIGLARREP